MALGIGASITNHKFMNGNGNKWLTSHFTANENSLKLQFHCCLVQNRLAIIQFVFFSNSMTAPIESYFESIHFHLLEI